MTGISLGVDIVEVRRVARLVKNARFVERVFSEREVAYCRDKKNAAQHFAVRFAAKEAVYKALGQPGVAHKEISVKNDPSGKPRVELAPRLKRYEPQLSLTLSHTADYAVAVALFQREHGRPARIPLNEKPMRASRSHAAFLSSAGGRPRSTSTAQRKV